MMEFGDPVAYAIPAFVGLIALEVLVGARLGKARYDPRDAATSIAMGLGSLVSGAITASVVLALYSTAHSWRVFDLGTSLWLLVPCFLLDDLAYYWFHRMAHRVRWFWASHVVHHSSQHYNLSTAVRQTWTGFFSLAFIYRIPILLIGFDPAMVLFCAGANLVYQFWIHTESIDRLGPLEWVMNTPSHHRVHHATNPRYLDANYAGTFIIWDRMFGTFVAEEPADPPKYGIIKNIKTFNPLWVAVHEWIGLFRDIRSAASWRERLGHLLQPPGWVPDGEGLTTDEIKRKWRMEKDRR